MTEVRLKYLHCFRDRHGHARYYFRYRGRRWTIPAPHEEGFAQAYESLKAQIKSGSLAPPKNLAYLRGSLGWVIERFLESSTYSGRAETTKRNYRRVLEA